MPRTKLGDFYYEGRTEPKVEVKKVQTAQVMSVGIPYTRTELRFKIDGLWRTLPTATNHLVKRYGMGRAGAGSWLAMLAGKVK